MTEEKTTLKIAECREVDMKELIWKILERWKLLFIVSLFFGIVFIGYKYSQDLAETKKSSNQNLSLQKIELTNQEREGIETAANIREKLEEQKKYFDTSVLMNLNSLNKKEKVLQYYVKTDKENIDYSSGIVEAYTSYVDSNAFINDVAKKINWKKDKRYLAELISINEIKNEQDFVFSICIIEQNQQETGAIIKALQNSLDSYGRKINQSICKHSVILLSSSENTFVDFDLSEKQLQVQNSIFDLQTKLDNLQSKFTEAQRKIFSGNESFSEKQNVKVRFNKTYFVFGVAFGIFFCIFIITIFYVFNKCVKSLGELERILAIPEIGEIRARNTESFIEKIKTDYHLYRIRFRDKIDYNNQLNLIRYKIKGFCHCSKISSVSFLVLDNLGQREEKFLNMIIDKVNKEGIQIHLIKQLADNLDQSIDIAELSNVIVIVTQDKTRYRELDKNLEICRLFKSNILGSILLDCK